MDFRIEISVKNRWSDSRGQAVIRTIKGFTGLDVIKDLRTRDVFTICADITAAEAEKITFFIYEQLLALKRAAKTLNLSAHDVENVMYGNARNIVDGARRSIYGE